MARGDAATLCSMVRLPEPSSPAGSGDPEHQSAALDRVLVREERNWRGSGIGFVLFFIVAYVIYGSQPKVGASAGTLVSGTAYTFQTTSIGRSTPGSGRALASASISARVARERRAQASIRTVW